MVNTITAFSPNTDILSNDVNKNFKQAMNQGVFCSGLTSGSATTSTSATLIKAANADRGSILIRNNGSVTMYVGATGVTATSGYKLLPSRSLYLNTTEAIYGVTSTLTADTRYLEAATLVGTYTSTSSFSTGQVSVTSTATQILAANTGMSKRIISNIGAVTVFISGTNTVGTGTGFPVLSAEELNINDYTGIIYGVSSTANTVNYMEQG